MFPSDCWTDKDLERAPDAQDVMALQRASKREHREQTAH